MENLVQIAMTERQHVAAIMSVVFGSLLRHGLAADQCFPAAWQHGLRRWISLSALAATGSRHRLPGAYPQLTGFSDACAWIIMRPSST